MEISLKDSVVGGNAVLEVHGEVDFFSAPSLQDRLAALIHSGSGPLLVNLCSVGFIDSTGLGAMVGCLTLANERKRSLRVVCDQERVLKLFRITGLDSIFKIYASTDEALAELAQEVSSYSAE